MSDKIPNMDYDADEVIENFKSKFKWPTKSTDVEVVVTPPKLPLKILISFLITAIVGFGVYYMMIPALNFKSTDFYVFLLILIAVFCASFAIVIGARKKVERREYAKKKSIIPLIIVGVLLVVMGVGFVVGCTLFRATDYSNIMQVKNSNFSEDFKDIKYDEVPQLDSATAEALADQELGSLDEYMSQYVVSSVSTQINFSGQIVNAGDGRTIKFDKDSPVRVAYLEYADAFKWLNNTKHGIPAYMVIDVVNQTAYAVDCAKQFGSGITYSPSELFSEKLVRHLRFQYPSAIMDTPNFELDDSGHPYWITPVLDKTIGLFGGTDVKGVIITDALNGKSEYHDIDKIKSDKQFNWIDVVYSENLIVQQYNYHGKLSGGFWNSIFFQDDANVASDGNGYIALNGDVWVYTGITSLKSDTSNFGFILCNQRTKETRYYKNGGAKESSAQGSAKDAVQNYGYSPTFPILLNIGGKPTYFMSLYGDDFTVKGYAYVSLNDKTIVGYCVMEGEYSKKNACLKKAKENYEAALTKKGQTVTDDDDSSSNSSSNEATTQPSTGDNTSSSTSGATTVTGEVTDIKTTVNNGNTVFYLKVNGKYYYITATECMDVLLVEKGNTVTVTFDKDADTFVQAKTVKIK